MGRNLRSVLKVALSFGFIVLVVLALVTSSATPAMAKKPTPTPPTSADFSMSLNMDPDTYPYHPAGYLDRGGSAGPQYWLCSYGGCFWATNWLGICSRNDFAGDVTVEFLNLPPGVTDETADSVFVPARSCRIVYIYLRAAPDAALGKVTVTIRGTSGSLVHDRNMSLTLVEDLPVF